MIYLEKEFTGIGEVSKVRFNQVLKSDKAYLYKLTWLDTTSYEVILRNKVPICIDFMNKVFSQTDFKETYPKAHHFGTKGWAFNDYDKAVDKFKTI